MRACARCGEEKPTDYFYAASAASGQEFHSWCKQCVGAYQVDRLNRRRADPLFVAHERELARQRTRRAARKLRLTVLAAYGDKCACCGETEEAFLAIDHVNDDGAEERRRLGIGRANPDPMTFYRYVRDEGFPDRYQILCHNCNSAKAHRGECPHETERAALVERAA